MRVGVELMMTNISVAKSSLLPSKMMQGTCMRAGVVGAVLAEEMQRRQPVLAVDDQVLRPRLLQVADVLEALERIEVQPLGREQQHGSRDRRLAHGRLIEVLDRRHLGLREVALERAVAALDREMNCADVVVLLDLAAAICSSSS